MAENKTENPGTEEMEVRLAQLNQFTRRTLTQEEVFLFDVRLCDNEIDRDGERFSLEALEQLKTLFVGKTGIFDHNLKGENQTARLYAAELVQDPERITAAGEVYTFLKGHAYMVRTDANRDLIREIDGGIKKEVSISCAAASQTCSVCGGDRRNSPCSHRIGQRYGDKLCHVVLGDVTDAYEWSFVAVPAQREAGVTKQFRSETDGAQRCKQLEQQLQNRDVLLNRMENALRQDVVRLRFLVEGCTEKDAVSAAVERMNPEELLAFRETLRTRQKHLCQAQLKRPDAPEQNGAFRMM